MPAYKKNRKILFRIYEAIQNFNPSFKTVYIFFTAIALSTAIFRGLGNTDEIWNYSFAASVASFRLPYRDFNMLQTPLSAVIPGFVMMLTGQHLIITRIMGAFLYAASAALMWRISRRYAGRVFISLLPGLLFLFLFVYNIFFEYSGLIIFCETLLIDLDTGVLLSGKKPTAKFLILTGLIGGAAILSKQTFGLFIACASWFSAFFISKGARIKAFFLRGLGSAVPCFIALFYFLMTGTFDDFLDMCLYGISSFVDPWYYPAYMKSETKAFVQGLLWPLSFLIGIVYALFMRKKKIGKLLLINALYVIFSFINMYPLANSYHINASFAPCAMMAIPPLLAITNPLRGKKSAIVRTGLNIAAFFGAVICGAIIFVSRPYDMLINKNQRMSFDIKHYEGIFISSSMREEMNELDEVISTALDEKKDIYIIDNAAEIYFIPYDIYHKNMDMLLYGNTGTKTPEEILEDSLTPGAYYLCAPDDKKNTQFPWKEMRAFKEKLTYIGENGPYELYEAQ